MNTQTLISKLEQLSGVSNAFIDYQDFRIIKNISEYEVYYKNQAEESDPDPVFKSDSIHNTLLFLNNGFIDYIETKLTQETIDELDITEDYYLQNILKSLEGKYDDLEDYLNIQEALHKALILNQKNIRQLTLNR